jgi:hypothetical protein
MLAPAGAAVHSSREQTFWQLVSSLGLRLTCLRLLTSSVFAVDGPGN